jgi:hypothetical protein
MGFVKRVVQNMTIYAGTALIIKWFWKDIVVAIVPGLVKGGFVTEDIPFSATLLTAGLICVVSSMIHFVLQPMGNKP